MRGKHLLVFIVVLSLFINLAYSADNESIEYPFIDGYAVTGVPYNEHDEFELNGYVYGNIINEDRIPVLQENWILGDLSDIVGCEDIVLIIDDSRDMYRYGYFDRKSSHFCEPLFDDISLYTKNDAELIAVMIGGRWGFCKRSTGEMVIPYLYDGVLEDFTDGYAIVVVSDGSFDYYDERFVLIDQKGNETVFPDDVIPVSTPNEAGYLIIARDEFYGIGHVDGTIVVEPHYNKPPALKDHY